MSYTLTDDDRRVIAATTGTCTEADLPRLEAIHQRAIDKNEERLLTLKGEIHSIERAQAMRAEAIHALRAAAKANG